jgi:hypothetical protein
MMRVVLGVTPTGAIAASRHDSICTTFHKSEVVFDRDELLDALSALSQRKDTEFIGELLP